MKNQKSEEKWKEISEYFANLLEERQEEWYQGWEQLSLSNQNPVTKKKYKGYNILVLAYTAQRYGYKSPYWVTFKQASSKGWKVKAGEKGTPITFFEIKYYNPETKECITANEYKELDDEEKKKWKQFFYEKGYVVFNTEQLEGENVPTKADVTFHDDVEIDMVVTDIQNGMEIPIVYGGDNACYVPSKDEIHLPEKEMFLNSYEFNSTALHELAHASGSPKRLNRNLKGLFGDEDYAFEELIAELTSAILSSELHVSEQDEQHLNNHKAYLQGWIKAIREKPTVLQKAMNEAYKASEYMLGFANI